MERDNCNNKEFLIEKIESCENEINEIDKNIILNDNRTRDLDVARIITIIIGLISLVIKFPKVFNQEFLLNYVCVILSTIGFISSSLLKEVLKQISYYLYEIRDTKIFSIKEMEKLLENNKNKQLVK